MNKTMIVALLAATLALPMLAHASTGDCDSKGNPALGTVNVADSFYVDDRNYALGNGLWVYQESNGIAGLQRGGSSDIVPDDNEICTDDSTVLPDHLIF